MIAIHKESGTLFKVINTTKNTFSGKVIKSNDQFWSEGEVGYNLEKSRFNITISWKELENLKSVIENFKINI